MDEVVLRAARLGFRRGGDAASLLASLLIDSRRFLFFVVFDFLLTLSPRTDDISSTVDASALRFRSRLASTISW